MSRHGVVLGTHINMQEFAQPRAVNRGSLMRRYGEMTRLWLSKPQRKAMTMFVHALLVKEKLINEIFGTLLLFYSTLYSQS
jgi:hypothetical protein